MQMYRISSDWKVGEITCHIAGILKPGNGLAGIRHFGMIETPRRTHVQFQHLACISFMVNALTYRIFLIWSSRISSENLPSVNSFTLK